MDLEMIAMARKILDVIMKKRQIKKKDKANRRRLLLMGIMDVTSSCLQLHGKDGDREIIAAIILKTKMVLKDIRLTERVTVYPVTSLDNFIKCAWTHKSRYTAEALFKLI